MKKKALKLLLEVLPENAFYGKKEEPEIVMTDDSSTEREALSKVWPNARLLLCIFHIFFCKGIGHQGLSFGFDQILTCKYSDLQHQIIKILASY